MSLPLSGQLGSAQLGAAQLGQLASAAVQGAFMLPPAGGGAVVEEPNKKKKRKKRKRVKVLSSDRPTQSEGVELVAGTVSPNPTRATPTVTLSERALEDISKSLNAIERDCRHRLEILEEDDELIELGVL